MTESRTDTDRPLLIGTSAWSTADWRGLVYPEGCRPSEYIRHYVKHFPTVEIDSTFYRIPSEASVTSWRQKTPDRFLFAAKFPRSVTHESRLEDCRAVIELFVDRMLELGGRLGPLLMQFPYFKKADELHEPATFLRRLEKSLGWLPRGPRYALEVRNKAFLVPELLAMLRAHRIALAMIDHPWMPRIDRLLEMIDPVTADFLYVRWLGDRYGIEKKTTRWDRLIIDRTREMNRWVRALSLMTPRVQSIFGYFNNHYAGHAPGSVELFWRAWDSRSV